MKTIGNHYVLNPPKDDKDYNNLAQLVRMHEAGISHPFCNLCPFYRRDTCDFCNRNYKQIKIEMSLYRFVTMLCEENKYEE